MRQKYRILAGLLGLLLLFGTLAAAPALATEAPAPYTEGEGTSGEDPGYEEDPPYEEPEPDPEPEDPTLEPTDSPDTQPTEPPATEEPGWEEEPTPEPEYTDPPEYTEPTEEPWYEEPTPEPDPTEDPMLGWLEDPTPSPDPTATLRPRATSTPRASATPKASLNRPKVTPHPAVSGTEEEEDDTSEGPDYRTFARLNQRNNSMSITLFYGGLGCVVIGAAGLITLLVLFLRNRRVDQRDHLIKEIELAENRAPTVPQRPQPPAQANPAPQASQKPVQRQAVQNQPNSGTGPIVPEEASLYTEEFTLPEVPKPQAQRPAQASPAQQRPAAPQASQKPVQRQPAQNQPASGTGPIVPQEASLYTEEFTLPEIPKPQAQRPAPQPPKAPDPAKQFDTDEILREVLRQTTDNNNDH